MKCRGTLLLSALIWLCAIAWTAAVQAQPVKDARVQLLFAGNSTYSKLVEQALVSELARQDLNPAIARFDVRQGAMAEPMAGELLVAVGVEATRHALQHWPRSPLLSLFIPSLTWQQLLQEYPGGTTPRAAVFIDQPFDRLIALARLIKPGVHEIGTVFGPTSTVHSRGFSDAVEKQHLHLNQATLNQDKNPIAVITPVIDKSELFVAIPDQSVFNRSIAKWVLYLSYRRHIPVIGFSRSYTEAGALISIFSSPADIGRQGGELVAGWLQGADRLSFASYFPAYYQLLTNAAVARSLGIKLPATNQLIDELDKIKLTDR